VTKRPEKSDLPLVSGPQLAALVNLTVRQLNRLAMAGVIRKARRGSYALSEAIPGLIDYYRRGREGSGDLAEEKLRLTVAQRREVEQRTSIRARELIPLDAVRTGFDTAMTIVGSQLEGLGGRIANDLATETDAAKCKHVIFNECRRIRAAAAAQLEAVCRDPGRPEASTTTEGDERV
jgi:hypothetical protein